MDERPVAVSIIEGSERIVPALLAFQEDSWMAQVC
jgi:hypothetical protein